MVAEVIVDIVNSEVDRVFDYEIPENLDISSGDRVLVPFGRMVKEGFVVSTKSLSAYGGKLKAISGKPDGFSALTESALSLAKSISKKLHITLAETLRLFIPSEMRGGRVSEREVLVATLVVDADKAIEGLKKNAARQRETIERLRGSKEVRLSELNASAVRALRESGVVEVKSQVVGRVPYVGILTERKQVTLSYSQREAVRRVEAEPMRTFLLHGVTGSGKTEVYIELIKNCLSRGKTAIMLVPEIGLTPQVMRRFRGEFGEAVALLHSGLGAGERYDEWLRLRRGEATVAVGPRSAIFAPLEGVGLIIIDEQHEQSYVSENSPRYNAIEVAKMRKELEKATLVMGSATPLVESYYRAKKGEYVLLELKERAKSASLPEVITVDMCREARRGNNTMFSSVLMDELQKTLSRGEQAMLFINRRGYSPIVMCNDCGYVAKCLSCDVTLNYHKGENALVCHYCGTRYRMLDECPECGGSNLRRSGMGTEQAAAFVSENFPSARVVRMDNDTTRTKEGHLEITGKFYNHEADVLVGTQMIAKGHDFSLVTLVGVLDADMGLYMSDYRSGERTFSLLTQVSGRAGRDELSGKVVVQTRTPEHYILRLAAGSDYRGFYDREIAIREAAKFPPYCDIFRFMCQGEDEEKVKASLKSLVEILTEFKKAHSEKVIFLGKMKSPVKRIMNKYRYQAVMRIKDIDDDMRESLYSAADSVRSREVGVYLEVNPVNMS